MNKEMAELVFILDKSGSMGGLEKDTVGGYNAMLEKQREIGGECLMTTVLFDHTLTLLHDRIDLRAVSPITGKDYTVGGSTALADAVGSTIRKIENAQKHTAEDYRAGRVLFVIITDGEENASREFSPRQVREMIRRHQAEDGWEFLFLGANMDAAETAEAFGIDAERTVDYVPDSRGTALNFRMMSEAAADFRGSGAIKPERLEKIREDMKQRRGR